MSIGEVVTRQPGLTGEWRAGLQAIKAVDRQRITCGEPRSLTGSVDLDAACRQAEPTAPRWDYLVGRRVDGVESLHCAEVHGARTNAHCDEVMAKADWLKRWLRTAGLVPKDVVWIATDGSDLAPRDPRRMRLAKIGVTLVRHWRL